MKVRYNMYVGILFVVLGAVSTVLGLWLTLLGDFSPGFIVGVLCLVLGILYLARTYFWVHENAVVVPAVVGPLKREFPFQSLTFDGGKMIAVRPDGTSKKVPVARWMSNTGDWNAVMTARSTPGRR